VGLQVIFLSFCWMAFVSCSSIPQEEKRSLASKQSWTIKLNYQAAKIDDNTLAWNRPVKEFRLDSVDFVDIATPGFNRNCVLKTGIHGRTPQGEPDLLIFLPVRMKSIKSKQS
jgi:hypothetical protein